jgi:putative salt-induced outer membrane protein YdiY
MVEREQLRQDDHPDAGQRTTELRFSSYAVAQVALMENLTLAQTVYVQPRADDFSDLRVLNETSLTAKANERVGLTVGFILFLDRAPPAGVSPLDTQLRTALAVSF